MEIHSSNALNSDAATGTRSVTTAVSSSSLRVANIDRLRILAAVGIVWFHTDGAPLRTVGYTGLPIFLLIFFSLIVRNTPSTDTLSFLKRRFNRLIVPWLFWSLVYGLSKAAKAICTTDMSSVHDMLSFERLLVGTHVHLWYLPYAFVLGCVMHEVNRRTWKLGHAAVSVAATAAGVFLLAAGPVGLLPGGNSPPVPQWNFGLAAVSLGFAIGRCLAIPSRNTRRLLLSIIAAATLPECIILNSAGFAGLAIPYGLAIVLVCAAYAWEASGDAFVTAVAPLTFGIYLIHPLIGIGLQHVLVASRYPAAFILLTAAISGLATLILTRTPLKRYV